MSALPPVSEHALLDGLVAASLGFAALALLIWSVTFLVRAGRLRATERRNAAMAELTAWVLEEVAKDGPVGRPPPLPPARRRLLSAVLRDLIAGTRGRDQERFIALLETTGLRAEALRSVASGSAPARQEAAEILGHLRDDASRAALAGALDDRDAAVRLVAARALLRQDRIPSLRRLLEQLRFPAADPPLSVADLLDDLPERLRPEAIGLLAADALPAEWRRFLALSLARTQVFAAFDAIAALRRCPDARLRAAAWVALERLGDPRASELVAEGLSDAEVDVRRTAARCAGHLGGPSVVPALERLLASADWWERHQAATALLALGSAGREAVRRHLAVRPDDEAVTQAGEDDHGL